MTAKILPFRAMKYRPFAQVIELDEEVIIPGLVSYYASDPYRGIQQARAAHDGNAITRREYVDAVTTILNRIKEREVAC